MNPNPMIYDKALPGEWPIYGVQAFGRYDSSGGIAIRVVLEYEFPREYHAEPKRTSDATLAK